jgi:hypothetical protein
MGEDFVDKIIMPTIQQEAFVFGHEINRRMPTFASRNMEIIMMDANDLLRPSVIKEIASLLKSEVDLLVRFSALFLPQGCSLEIWRNTEEHKDDVMLVSAS